MAGTMTRRPLPALVALLALLLLTALVWWRVLNRSSGAGPDAAGGPTHSVCPSPTPTRTAIKATLPAPADVTVRVLNATSRSGIAGKAQDALVHDGFRARKAASNDHKHLDKIKAVAEIRYGRTSADAAKLLRYYLPGAHLVRLHHPKSTVVISLGKKYRHVATPAQVQAAMRADSVAASTSPAPPPAKPTNC